MCPQWQQTRVQVLHKNVQTQGQPASPSKVKTLLYGNQVEPFKSNPAIATYHRVMHQPINAVVTNFIASRKEGEAETGEDSPSIDVKDVKVAADDIELPDRRNNKVIVSDDTKLEEMAQMSCNIETKVISILIYI